MRRSVFYAMFLNVILVISLGFLNNVIAQDANANASANVTTGSVTNSSTTTVTQGGTSVAVGSPTMNNSVEGQTAQQTLNQTFEAGNAPRIPDPAITIIPPTSPLPQIAFPLLGYVPVKGDANVPPKDVAEGFTQIVSLPYLTDGFTRRDARRVVSQIEKKEGLFRVKRRIPATHIVYRENPPLSEPEEEVKYSLDVIPDLNQWEAGVLTGMAEVEEFLPMDILIMKAFLEIPKDLCATHFLFLSGGILYTKSTSEAKGLVLGGGTVGGATPGAHVITGVLGWGEIEGSTHSRHKSRIRAYAYCLRGQKQASEPVIDETAELAKGLESARLQQKILEENLRRALNEKEQAEKEKALLIIPESPEQVEFGYNETNPLPRQEERVKAMADWIIQHAEAVQTLKGAFTTFGLSDQCGEFKVNDFFAAERASALQKLLLAELAGRGRTDIDIRTASEGERWVNVKKAETHPSCNEAKNRIATVRYVGASNK